MLSAALLELSSSRHLSAGSPTVRDLGQECGSGAPEVTKVGRPRPTQGGLEVERGVCFQSGWAGEDVLKMVPAGCSNEGRGSEH